MQLKIIFEDNHLLVLDKPADLLTQEAEGKESLECFAKSYLKEKYQKSGGVYLQAIHRLDKPVSGVVVFAKSRKALSRLNAELRNKRVVKKYVALVEGKLPKKSGSLEHNLFHGEHKALITKNEEGALAKLSYKFLKKIKDYSLIEIDLETGRYHQIRAQFSEIDCPIVGDKKYGSQTPFSKGIALHHLSFTITHPTTKEEMTFKANLPNWTC